ncbi:hypothetical protein RJ640_008081 [Escallonia rubra]|uniref:Uncharacterized protein n=1 Tax=Escallonia rubra TaxID=112253 RepID=A0AA88R732_9ASTE|nr:hypothetical protein RJ640_008081 [Escallonia rubra]
MKLTQRIDDEDISVISYVLDIFHTRRKRRVVWEGKDQGLDRWVGGENNSPSQLTLVGNDIRSFANSHGNTHVLHQQLGIHVLVGLHGPREYHNPGNLGFQNRVPPAVTQEPAHGSVTQYRHLWCPPSYNPTSTRDPCFEPIRCRPVPICHLLGRQCFNDPNETDTAPFKPNSQGLHLGLSQELLAPKAHIYNGTIGTPIKPSQHIIT